MFVLGSFFFKFVTGTNYEQKEYAPAPLPSTDFESKAAKYSASQAIADVSASREVIDYAYGEYEKRDPVRPFPGV